MFLIFRFAPLQYHWIKSFNISVVSRIEQFFGILPYIHQIPLCITMAKIRDESKKTFQNRFVVESSSLTPSDGWYTMWPRREYHTTGVVNQNVPTQTLFRWQWSHAPLDRWPRKALKKHQKARMKSVPKIHLFWILLRSSNHWCEWVSRGHKKNFSVIDP